MVSRTLACWIFGKWCVACVYASNIPKSKNELQHTAIRSQYRFTLQNCQMITLGRLTCDVSWSRRWQTRRVQGHVGLPTFRPQVLYAG
ncbi:hypothetical protein F4604DRAFT_1798319 [Suillus subluteus]|nr:hypothetical protein F4604DRAFT_1798319 [Suillus subluteus]